MGSKHKSTDTITPLPHTKVVFPIRSNGEEGRWRIGRDNLIDIYQKGYVRLGAFTKTGMAITYLANGEQQKINDGTFKIIGHREDGSIIEGEMEIERAFIPGTQWDILSHNATYHGSQFLNKIFGEKRFDFPKSIYAVQDTLRFFVANKPNALIVDFFSGSGTTAHAIMLLNHLDGGKRKSISITNNEIGSDMEKEFVTKKKLRPTDAEWQKYGITKYITWERIKAAMTGINTKGEPIKGDYKFTEEFPMSEGFKENAVFFDLKYEDGKAIRLNMTFEEIAPLLWMRAGCKGRIIDKINPKGYDISDEYAILFDFIASKGFIKDIKDSGIKIAYIVTDSEALYQQIYKQLPKGVEPVRLYENYLTSFAIYGAV